MKIYIGFSKPNKFKPFAWLIQKVENRDYDHVYIRLIEPITNSDIIFQASSTMVNLYNPYLFFNNNVTIKEYEIDITVCQYKVLWIYIVKNLGIPYSLIEDFGILLMKIFNLKNQPFNRGQSAEFCSKLGANVCNILNISMPENVSNIDPTLLDQILSNKQLKVVVANGKT